MGCGERGNAFHFGATGFNHEGIHSAHSQKEVCGTVHGVAEPGPKIPERMRRAWQDMEFHMCSAFAVAPRKVRRLSGRDGFIISPMQ